MSTWITLKSEDGHPFDAYTAGEPGGPALVVLQEIFGVNRHIRSVADDYAAEGFYVLAPALFDRLERKVELDYSPEGAQRGRDIAGKVHREHILWDINATFASARQKADKVGVIGYCLGGSYAWLSSLFLHPDAAVSYYGSQVARNIYSRPRCPVIFHFGRQDKAIPLSDVELIREVHSELPVYLYDAGHGFNCSERANYSAEAATLAWNRSLAFLKETLIGVHSDPLPIRHAA